jgi:hypothetical protein
VCYQQTEGMTDLQLERQTIPHSHWVKIFTTAQSLSLDEQWQESYRQKQQRDEQQSQQQANQQSAVDASQLARYSMPYIGRGSCKEQPHFPLFHLSS